MAHGGHETEIKLRIESVAAGRKVLYKAGFRVWKRRVFEANTIFDTEHRTLRGSQRLLRIRQAAKTATLTYKGPPETGKHKSREELELQVTHAGTLAQIFERLGMQPMFRYEKYRTEYKRAGDAGVATLDETPCGTFLELEGTPAWIDRTAKRLGYEESDYITASYGRIYLEWCEGQGTVPGDMVFGRRQSGK